MIKKRNANSVSGKNYEQYHIGCKPGDIASNIILVGDPQRAFRFSTHFDKIRFRAQHREYVTYTGVYRGVPLTVMAIGIGQGNMEIAMIEILQIVKSPVIIRCGTSSGLQKNIGLGDMVITDTIHDLGNIASYYKINKKHMRANAEITAALVEAAKGYNLVYHVGKTASAPGFYGPQGRNIKGFPITKPNIIRDLSKKKVMNLEMEMATMFSLASCKKIPVGGVCSAIGNRIRNDVMDGKKIMQTEERSILCTLKAFEILNQA